MQVLALGLARSSCVQQTGVIRAPEWKDGFDNATHARMLEAVRCSAVLCGRWEGSDGYV